ncbi:hypothetical protein MPER_13021 [Moniliophthora perniciosa FA553]|nr:hypothetical protein MPER_13021 [Moniliophthora perniciosa FA553]
MANLSPLEPPHSIQDVLLGPFVSVGLMLFLLGFYFLLFGLAVYFFWVRQTRTKRRLHLWWMTTLFVLSLSSASLKAGQTIDNAVLGFRAATTQDFDPLLDWRTTNATGVVLETVSAILYVLANCITDMILVGTVTALLRSTSHWTAQLYRCFVLWDSRRRFHIVAILVILFLTNVVGFIGAMMRGIGDATNQPTKSSADIHHRRIWWLSHEPREIMGGEIHQKYRQVITMIIESGFLYSAILVVHVAIKESLSSLGFGLDLFPLVALMVGIAPTLIILRSSLGLSESAIPDSRIFATLRFGEQVSTEETAQNDGEHTINLQSGSTVSGEQLDERK